MTCGRFGVRHRSVQHHDGAADHEQQRVEGQALNRGYPWCVPTLFTAAAVVMTVGLLCSQLLRHKEVHPVDMASEG